MKEGVAFFYRPDIFMVIYKQCPSIQGITGK